MTKWGTVQTNYRPTPLYREVQAAHIPDGCDAGALANYGHEVEVALSCQRLRVSGWLLHDQTTRAFWLDRLHDYERVLHGPYESVRDALDALRDQLHDLVLPQ